MRRRLFGSGEAALRIARRQARRQGDTETLDKLDEILGDAETAAIAGVALEDETGGGLFRDILRWIVENPEQFKDLLTFIIGLFTGAPVPTA